MTNLLEAILNIVNNNQLDLANYSKSRNKINAVGDSLEFFIKDAFCNSFNIELANKEINIYPQYFYILGILITFPEQIRQSLENLSITTNLEIKDIQIKSPNNPAKLLKSKLIIYRK